MDLSSSSGNKRVTGPVGVFKAYVKSVVLRAYAEKYCGPVVSSDVIAGEQVAFKAVVGLSEDELGELGNKTWEELQVMKDAVEELEPTNGEPRAMDNFLWYEFHITKLCRVVFEAINNGARTPTAVRAACDCEVGAVVVYRDWYKREFENYFSKSFEPSIAI